MGDTFFICQSESGDWYGIYINGKLYHEGHDIPQWVWMDILKMNKYFLEVKSYSVDDEYIGDLGCFPDKFDKLPKEVLS